MPLTFSLLAVVAVAAASSLVEEAELADAAVFSPGDGGIACFRIPATLEHRGVLLAFAEARHSSCSDGAAHEIAMRRSFDGGVSWSPLTLIAGNDTYWVGNPTVLEGANSSVVALMLARHAPGCAGVCEVGTAIVTSSDAGVTWTAPRDISAQIGTAAKSRPGPGLGLTLPEGHPHAGRMLASLAIGTYGSVQVVHSDDDGATWAAPAQPTLAGHGFDESQLALLSNGSVIVMMRHVAENWKGKAVARSDDGGVSWTNASYWMSLYSPVCQASIARIGTALYYSADNSSSHVRVRLTVQRSDDDGASWAEAMLVDGGPSAYSCLVPTPLARGGGCACAGTGPGSCFPCGGLLYEAAGPVLRFTRFPLAL